MASEIPPAGTFEFEKLVDRAARIRYPQLMGRDVPKQELDALTRIARGWVSAISEALESPQDSSE